MSIRNFRGFAEVTICFPENQIAIFIGKNGSGKSSVLDLLGSFLNSIESTIANALTGSKRENRLLKKKDIRVGQTETTNELCLGVGSSEITLRNSLVAHAPLATFMGTIALDKWLKTIQGETSDFSLPVLAHYPVGRHLSLNPTAQPSAYEYPQLAALDTFWNNFEDFVLWFRDTEDLENQGKIREKDFDHQHPFLAAVRWAIETFFSGLSGATIRNLQVERGEGKLFSRPKEDVLLVVNKNDQLFALNQLSSGEQALLLLVADLTRRLVIANPQLRGVEALQKGAGIVLIDEIEQHLHPAWQREVVPALCQTFPQTQFIIATHSPEVISSVERECVFMLDDFNILPHTPHTHGRDINSILYDLFGVEKRPAADTKKLHEFYQFLEDEKAEEAKKAFAELEAKWGADDVEVKRAQMYLEDLLD